MIDGKIVIRTEGKETINGKKYNKNTTLISGMPKVKPQAAFSRRTKEGIFRLDANQTEYLATPFSLRLGNNWKNQFQDGEIQYLAEKTETVKLLNREYKDSLKISFSGTKKSIHVEGYSYFAPDVGEIMTYMRMGDVIIEYVLDKYKS